MIRKIDIRELMDKGYSLELSIKDKDRDDIASAPISLVHLSEMEFDTCCYGDFEFDVIGETLDFTLDRLIGKMDVKKLANLTKIAKKYEWNYLKQEVIDNRELQRDWNQTLVSKINQAAGDVSKQREKDKRTTPLAIIASLETMAVIDSLGVFVNDEKKTKKEEGRWDCRTERTGTLSLLGRDMYTVYKNPYLLANKIIICQDEDLNGGALPEDCVTSVVEVRGMQTISNFK